MTVEDDARLVAALAAPVDVKTKPPIVKIDPRRLPSMADRGLRPVPSTTRLDR